MKDALLAFAICLLTVFASVVAPAMGATAVLPPEHARWCRMPSDILGLFFGDDHKGWDPTWCQEPRRARAAGAGYFLLTAGRGARASTWGRTGPGA